MRRTKPAVGLAAVIVVSVIAGPASAAAPAATAMINAELDATWQRAGVDPAARASDAAFLRRVTLDLVGRIPTAGEVNGFLADSRKDKRARMVDRLLASPDYAEHWADVYLDLIVGRQLRLRPRITSAVRPYFVRAFATNKPLDDLVGELVSTTGDFELTPAAIYPLSFFLRGKNVAQLAGTTARIFLGQQIQCAQCHDHPYDKRYRRKDFETFAANWSGLRRFSFRDPLFGYVVHTYDAGRGTRLQRLARTIRTSPLFAMVTVNRLWKQLFGRALSEPWDDLRAADAPKHPPLLHRLAAELRRTRFDQKQLLRAIVLSRAYQRSSVGASAAQRELFAAAAVRPLSADQLYRSQLQATGFAELVAARRGVERLRQLRRRMLRQYLFSFRDDTARQTDTFGGSVGQALLLRNHYVTTTGARARGVTVLARILRASHAPRQRLTWMFMAIYGRRMSPAEETRYASYLRRRRNRAAAYEDLFHAMLTSTEFSTNH